MTERTPYVLTGVGLVLGLAVLLGEPIPNGRLNLLVGATLLALAGGSVTYMIARNSGPGNRGPDF